MAPRIVVDTSVIIATVTHESQRPALIQLTEGAELYAPTSLEAEVGNAFSAMFRRQRITLRAARMAVSAFHKIALRLTPLDLEHALDLSKQLGIYAYDAYFISCALQASAPLLTLDGRQRAAAKKVGARTLELNP